MFSRSDDVEVNALSTRGSSISAIARHLGCDRKTVRAYRPPPIWLTQSVLVLQPDRHIRCRLVNALGGEGIPVGRTDRRGATVAGVRVTPP